MRPYLKKKKKPEEQHLISSEVSNMITEAVSKSGVGEALGRIQMGAKFFSIFLLVKLESKFYASKLQCWATHRLGIAIPKGRNIKA